MLWRSSTAGVRVIPTSVCVQEEERERRMDFVPEESAVNTETIEVSRLH